MTNDLELNAPASDASLAGAPQKSLLWMGEGGDEAATKCERFAWLPLEYLLYCVLAGDGRQLA
jgi:hypothetical protein